MWKIVVINLLIINQSIEYLLQFQQETTKSPIIYESLKNPYDFEINNFLYIDPITKFIYANSSSKGILKDNNTEIIDNSCCKENIQDKDLNNTKVVNNIENEICNFGQLQSPINLIDAIQINQINQTNEFNLTYNLKMSKMDWIPFFKKHNFGIEPKYIFENIDPHIILNSKLFSQYNKKYFLNNIHIHLSCENKTMGSEHAIDFEKFDGEIHLVYLENSELSSYALYESILLRVGIISNDIGALDKFLLLLLQENSTLQMNQEDWKELENIFDPTKTPLYVYHGSLTSFPCSENILWMILKYPAMAILRQIRKEYVESNKFQQDIKCSNYRELQTKEKQKLYLLNDNSNSKFKLLNTYTYK